MKVICVVDSFFQDDFINTDTCTMSANPKQGLNGALLYASLVPHLIPSVALTPILVRCTGLRHQTRIRRDISSDYLATDDEMRERQVATRKQIGGRSKGVSICEEENVVFDYHEEEGSTLDEESETRSLDDYTARVST